ncbi:uncharacterized protein HD556DRAFT_1310644 [Suillus plorans]|uniref:DUF4189 domain-containing protein n=1 Tax=Suillus plorans TaxID=116603 RepID=A0A9P7AIY5_9AGAM|nr:uncharacterized protein HD556DRAFT_1310644 [Suillus plorans]KAG1790436.1 hypothetical protein HD556DRAFT_1310644 [Suillus plorans]
MSGKGVITVPLVLLGSMICCVSQTKHIKPPRSPSSDTAYDTSDDDIIGPITPPPILHELSIYSKSAKNRPKPYHRCGPNIIERLYGEECSGCNDSKNGIQGDKRRLEHLTPAALAQAVIAIQADIEWRRVRALAAALHVNALNQCSKFIGITVKSEAETYGNAVSEPLETAIEALSGCTTDDLNDSSCRIAVYERDVTSFATADTEFDEVEKFALTLLEPDDASWDEGDTSLCSRNSNRSLNIACIGLIVSGLVAFTYDQEAGKQEDDRPHGLT